MSDRNIPSDTSRVIVKNPLLSAVAGSIDDFVNSSILLPAAEIPPPPPTITLSSRLHENQESKDNQGKINETTN